MQWLKTDPAGTEVYPLNGSVVQRLQRFATYGSLKQQVLRIITDELALSNEQGKEALKKVRNAAVLLTALAQAADAARPRT